MPMLRASIYNPALGSNEDIQDQLILHYGKDELSEQLKQIGIAQGLAELSNSIDGAPVSWVKTTYHLMVLTKVEGQDSQNWREGYWIFATVDLDEFPLFVLRSIQDAYHKFRLLNGSFTYCSDNEITFEDYWIDFFSGWSSQYSVGALAMPQYLRLVSGVLSPDMVQEIDDVCTENGLKDVFVFSSSDYSFYWPGKHLDLDIRVDVQNLLFDPPTLPSEKQPEPLLESSLAVLELETSRSSSTRANTPTPEPTIGNETQGDTKLLAKLHHEPVKESSPPLPQSAGFLSDMSSYLPNVSYMNAANLPLPSGAGSMFARGFSQMPQAPSLETLKKPFESFGSLFSGQRVEKPPPPVSRIIHSMQVMIKDERHYLIAYQEGDFVFTFISDKEIMWGARLEHSCTLMSRDMEGMSFAADPPNPFSYIVLDSCNRTLTSTLPLPRNREESQIHELIAQTLLSSTKENSEFMRTASNWWVQHSVIDENMEAIFCSKCSDSDISEFIGIHKATDDWVHSYRRRRGL